MDGMGDVPELKLKPRVRKVLAALDARAGVKLSVREISTAAKVSPAVARVALAELEKAKLVQHTLQMSEKDRPPHTVYWIRQAGRDVHAHLSAARQPSPTDDR